MTTQLQLANRHIISDLMLQVAVIEQVEPEFIRDGIEKGYIVIVPGSRKDVTPTAVGTGMLAKIYTNLGTSSNQISIEQEILKAQQAQKKGANVIIDQSTAGDIESIRKLIIYNVNVPVGSIPLYETFAHASRTGKDKYQFSSNFFLEMVNKHIEQGITNLGFHVSLCKKLLSFIESTGRLEKITSRGCGLLADWIIKSGQENPYYEIYDDLLDLLAQNDLPITLVANRTGAIVDGYDAVSIYEYDILGELVQRARNKGVGAIVNGLGHMPLGKIPESVKLCKEKTYAAPLGVLGPAVTDLAHGHDHINAAIGSAMALLSGADYINSQTRYEHLGLPTAEAVLEGVIASKIACKASDNSRYPDRAMISERQMDESRIKMGSCVGKLNLCIDPEGAVSAFKEVVKSYDGGCSICGAMCTYQTIQDLSI